MHQRGQQSAEDRNDMSFSREYAHQVEPAEVQTVIGRRPVWWLRLASWGWDQPQYQLQIREKTRRSQLLGWLLLGLFIADGLLIALGIGDVGTLIAVAVIMGGLVLSTFLNRKGFITAAGSIPVVVICLAIFFSLLSEPNGLDLDAIPAYDLLVISVVVAAAVLEPAIGFLVAVVNVLLILGDFFLQPHAIDLTVDIASYSPPTVGIVTLLARPIALEIVIAIIAFLWSRGLARALQRADRAEEIAALQRQIVEQKDALDRGITALLAVHTRASNGDFNARVDSIPQQSALWTVALSLNNLMSRVQRSAGAEYQLTRTNQELGRINEALQDILAGRRPILPAATNTSADPIVASLRQLVMALSAGNAGGTTNESHGVRPYPGSQPPHRMDMPYGRPTADLPPPSGPGYPSYPPFTGEEERRRENR